MFKKAIRIIISLSLILSIFAAASIGVSAGTVVTAGTSTYEIAQDFENVADDATLVSSNVATQETAQMLSGPGAISGERSLQINVIAPGGYSKIDLAASLLPIPTMAAPDGVFFRVEFDKPIETGTGGTMITTLDGSYDGMQTAWVTNMSGANGYFGTYGGFKDIIIGYIFVPFPAAVWTTDKILGWDMRSNLPANSTMILDDIGYYKGTDYQSIVDSLNTASPLNPISLQGVTTNTYMDNVVVDNPIQMVINAYHKGGSTVNWFVDDTTKATIDENGLLTPIAPGPITIVAQLSGTQVIAAFNSTVVPGDVDLTCQELGNAHSAIYGLKVKLRAAPRHLSVNKSVVWTIVSGPATLADAAFDPLDTDADIAATPDVSCAMATFTDSGRVVIRAALAADPAIYNEYIIDVSPSFFNLQNMVFEAMALDPNDYTTEKWNHLKAVIGEVNELIDAGTENTTQAAVIAIETRLANAVSGTPDTDNGSPDTGSEEAPVLGLAFAVILFGGLIITLRKKRVNEH